jgi:dipeptidyl-peptidase-2/lysosomal Pro-X carboxypeptidase
VGDYYKPGGPVLFYQGNESPEFLCIQDFVMTEWAKELGAYLVGIEHRFFGESVPSNASDLIEKYKSLTLDNVMADSVTLITYLKSTIPEIASAKVITHGGRYVVLCYIYMH